MGCPVREEGGVECQEEGWCGWGGWVGGSEGGFEGLENGWVEVWERQ